MPLFGTGGSITSPCAETTPRWVILGICFSRMVTIKGGRRLIMISVLPMRHQKMSQLAMVWMSLHDSRVSRQIGSALVMRHGGNSSLAGTWKRKLDIYMRLWDGAGEAARSEVLVHDAACRSTHPYIARTFMMRCCRMVISPLLPFSPSPPLALPLSPPSLTFHLLSYYGILSLLDGALDP